MARDAKKQGLSATSHGLTVFALSGLGLALYFIAKSDARREQNPSRDVTERHLLAELTDEVKRLRDEVDYWKARAGARDTPENS